MEQETGKKQFYQMEKEEMFRELHADEKGVTSGQARERQEKDGYNELVEGNKKPLIMVFLEQFADFLVIILIVAGLVSIFLGDVESSLVIFVVITMNAILGTVQHVKAENSLESLKKISMPEAKVLRDGEVILIPSREIVVGDVVVLEAGDFVCADGRIIENASLKVSESAITGESVSVDKEDSVIEDKVPLGDRKNMVYSGSFITYGRGKFLVTKIGMDTEVGKIASLLKSTSQKKTPLQESLDDFGKKLAILIMIICAIVFGMTVYRGGNPMDAFMFAVALAVAAIPEALSSIVTIVLAFSTQKMVKKNAIVRKLQAVEGLGSISVICSDKTGTLTQNKMTVQKYYIDDTIVDDNCADFEQKLARKLLYSGVLCSDASIKDGTEIGDPTEVALVQFARKHGVEWCALREQYNRVAEIPFDSDRKLMSTAIQVPDYINLITKGAVDVLINRLTSIETADGVRPITKEDIASIEAANEEFSKEGLRVLAFAVKEVEGHEVEALNLEHEQGLTFIGLIAMMDPPREESRDAVEACIKAGIRPVMITGDHQITAVAIAKKIGIMTEGAIAIDGEKLDDMSDEELESLVEKVSVYARVSPEHKIRIVKAWQKRGNIVAMTGDGVNDAPALRQADIGVAMGITGTEVAKDAASVVLMDDNFVTIVHAVENGRNVYANIQKAIKFLLSGNTAGILSVLYASLLSLPVPFAPVHLLFINLLTDSLPAISLGLNPHSSQVMEDKPRPKNQSILTKDFLIGIGLEGLVIAINTMIAFHVGLSWGADTNAGGEAVGMTMAFATLCFSRLVHGFNSKSERPVIFTGHMFDNKYLNLSFLLGTALLACTLLIPGLSELFKVAPLTPAMFGVIAGCGFLNLVVIQILKAIRWHLKKKNRS